jgi:DNA-binding response OmpR family regulator
MHRVLVIDEDRPAVARLGLECLEQGMVLRIAENVCEGVRALVREVVSLIVVDAALLRLTPWEHATMFSRVAPGVPVSVVVAPDASLETRAGLEQAGFRVLTQPVSAAELLEGVTAW